MKTTQIFLFALLGCTMALAQTNTFPASGNVGIGTTSPTYKLQVDGSGFKLGGSYTQTNLRIEATDDSGAPAKAIGLQLHGYEGRAKGIYITDKDTSHKWFIGEGYAYNGIGIGYSTTSQMEYGANAKFFVGTSGNIGIGTTSPSNPLHITSSNENHQLRLEGTSGKHAWIQYYPSGTGVVNWKNGVNAYGFNIYDMTNAAYRLTISNSGNIGIGTVDPGTWKLAVKGKIRAEEIKVETGWSDFVFESDYDLPTLEEVEEHIQYKGHLKDIPSAEEVAENGILLGEMDSKLLQKIEELTLYMIDMNKQIQQLQKENAELRNER
ncbi:hypothetical protein [Ulvibacterium marinum]|uniref:Peptidase S74 domain-containing protein n=1 Tax=Ulvibacterium marinum TaxID=2419782 RepID=A0A3B0C690_9FLAO|nr:hypothetical protein [Ulvibacterium marinum]RKN81653.1 hypothetical protein D7Z94_12170 [Ulvibacterium marinum]